ncbi:hypothetical protein DKG34_38305 [Streptomyces sp. NWU49]|nr:hypothetical protein DKG34_38305 [Streptomyces sp. NWU49]
MAIAPQGCRGSQLDAAPCPTVRPQGWRSPCGAIEDCNDSVTAESKSGILLAVASGVTAGSWDRSIELPNLGGSLAVGFWAGAAFA